MAQGWDKEAVQRVLDKHIAEKLPAKAKYSNVKFEADGKRFDSKKEARIWLELKARQAAGEISRLQHHAPLFPLYARTVTTGINVQVSYYEPDFTFEEAGQVVVMDAKGHRTQLYCLKKKWLELQDGIVICEV